MNAVAYKSSAVHSQNVGLLRVKTQACTGRHRCLVTAQHICAPSRCALSPQRSILIRPSASLTSRSRRTVSISAAVEAPSQSVYTFGKGKGQGNASMKELLGGKGANLAEMCAIGLSVPPGFTITTETCAAFHENDSTLPAGVWEDVIAGLKEVEQEMGTKLGDPSNPLLLSVRSGAAVRRIEMFGFCFALCYMHTIGLAFSLFFQGTAVVAVAITGLDAWHDGHCAEPWTE